MSALVRERLQHVDAGRREQLRYYTRRAQAMAPDRRQRRTEYLLVLRGLWRQGLWSTRRPPDIIAVRAGTLDDTSWLWPVAHVYMRSAQAWEQMPDDTECFEIMPKDFWALTDKWQQMWTATELSTGRPGERRGP
jgi:hypothetical protein